MLPGGGRLGGYLVRTLGRDTRPGASGEDGGGLDIATIGGSRADNDIGGGGDNRRVENKRP